jgi:hypothetical protein
VETSIGELAAGAAEFPDTGPTLVLIGDALDAVERVRPEPEAASVPQVPLVDSRIYAW